MEKTTIINLLTNAGFNVFGMDGNFVYFQDPTCILPAFDTLFDFAWIVIVIFTAIMLFGWGALYIKNGVNINTLFNNAKTLILILFIFSITKPIVNFIYGDDIFAKQCDTKQVSLASIQELLDSRKQQLGQNGDELNFEIFTVIDSGFKLSFEKNNASTAEQSNISNATTTSDKLSISNVQSVEYQNNATIYLLINGERIKRSGGSTSWRNNNPGNIRKSSFALKNGAIGETDQWAVFPDEETGLRAMAKLLKSKNYVNLSIRGAINRWAPSSDNNNPEKYAQFVAKTSGLSIDSVINNLSDEDLMKMTRAMQKFEGWVPGIEQKM